MKPQIRGKVNLKTNFPAPSLNYFYLWIVYFISFDFTHSHSILRNFVDSLQTYATVWQPDVDLIIWLLFIFLFVRVGVICNHLEFRCGADLEIQRNAAEPRSESADHFLCMWWQGHSAWGCKYVCPIVVREQDPLLLGLYQGNPDSSLFCLFISL